MEEKYYELKIRDFFNLDPYIVGVALDAELREDSVKALMSGIAKWHGKYNIWSYKEVTKEYLEDMGYEII